MTYLRFSGFVLLFALFLSACDSAEDPAPTYADFEIEVNNEFFRIRLDDPDQIAAAEAAMEAERVGVLFGELERGDGGFNAPYSWHLIPETVSFPDTAIEVCSGRPQSDVEADLDYWIDTLGSYCPWGAEVVRRLP